MLAEVNPNPNPNRILNPNPNPNPDPIHDPDPDPNPNPKQVLRAKRGERLLLQGRQLNAVSDGPGAPMLEPLSATTPTVQSAASGDV